MGAAGCDPEATIIVSCSVLTFILLLLALVVVLSLFFPHWFSPAFLFFLQATFFIILFCLIPSIAFYATRRKGRVAQVALESILFTPLILGFGFWLTGDKTINRWMLYILGSTFIIEIGSHFLNHYKATTFERLSRSRLFQRIQHNAKDVEVLFHNENFLYASLPGPKVAKLRNGAI